MQHVRNMKIYTTVHTIHTDKYSLLIIIQYHRNENKIVNQKLIIQCKIFENLYYYHNYIHILRINIVY